MLNPTATMLRWYRQSTGRVTPQQQYTAQEVLQLLRPHTPPDDQVARTEAVRQVAARPSTWLGNLTKQQRSEIGQLADRLPSLLFHHTIGGDLDDLVRRFGRRVRVAQNRQGPTHRDHAARAGPARDAQNV